MSVGMYREDKEKRETVVAGGRACLGDAFVCVSEASKQYEKCKRRRQLRS